MDAAQFETVVDKHFRRQAQVLFHKAKEYADDQDRLRNFKIAAQLQGVTPRQALGGMLAKHLVSVFDLINDREIAPEHVWDEKLGDASNYLVLLKALTVEELAHQQTADKFDRPKTVIVNDPPQEPNGA